MTEAKGDVNSGKQTINRLVEQLDASLREEFGADLFQAGWCLLLGRHYGESPIVYFSLNPGVPRSGRNVDPTSRDKWNVPFSNPTELKSEYAYLQNCERFFGSDARLKQWIQEGVTSAFLVPWRTRNLSNLVKLNAITGGKLWMYAGEIARTVIQDHQARLLLLVGKASLRLLVDLKIVGALVQETAMLGPGGTYQWSRWRAEIDGRTIVILQIPHFSRANSPLKMKGLAQWLREQVAESEVNFLQREGPILAVDG